MTVRETFLKDLRGALNHLYDPDHLCRSPLAARFGVAGRFDTSLALRSILIEAIESLEPETGEAASPRDRSTYEILYYRYVQQLSQQEMMDQLAVCERHVRRKQRAALQVLADRLLVQYDLDASVDQETEGDAPAGVAHAGVGDTSIEEELAWLKGASPALPSDPTETILAALDRAVQLASRHAVSLEADVPQGLPRLAVHPIALSQTLLNLLGVAIHRAAGDMVRLSVRSSRQEVEIQVQARRGAAAAQSISRNDAASLDLAQHLAKLSGGRLRLADGETGFEATLTLPIPKRTPVLAIDDNADTLQLLGRYVSDTHYHLVGARDPEQALQLVGRLSPRIIVLDVMMPQVDGWEVLARLREHPLTRHIPIVVCTILSQEDLALALGASGFVHKPVSQQAFLEALDQQLEQMGPARR